MNTPVDIEKLKRLLKAADLPLLEVEPDMRHGMSWNDHIVYDADPNMRVCFMANGALSNERSALIVAALNSLPALIAKAERVDALDWLSGQTRLELHHYSPVYGDDDDQSVEWRVTQVSGPINDREWTTVGRGETALDAILSARNALSPKPEDATP